ncbi:PQQ-dependent sugar dehydrogenase [Tianweitania sp. BSSL-BM11]|uniref:PQQ-dependent sugar dehydrogenase n=1 Tax=Tianweitania aestuarii TaxID=2814886 RepID=A0ABS5RST8_9HYPH|nr:PQQ-dependent sugar dehydrogenase [Tianweitania aestuarii]MBS9720114.1 PQQ-dependent sugar dehydrogenase [Tianweitania aestuarii]
MSRFLTLFASTALSLSLAGVSAHAQSTGDTSPVEQVEGQVPASGDEGTPPNQPVETKSPNAPNQKPAFENQTRAPQPSNLAKVSVTTIAEGLPQLWAMEFLPDGRMLVTTKEGAMHVVSADGKPGAALEGVPDVDARGQGGLLDVALAPDFESSNRIFFSFSEPRDDGNGTSVASATLALDDNGGGKLEDVKVIFQQTPSWQNNKHFGSRIVPTEDGQLYVTVGERSDSEPRVQAQDLSSGLGKVFRIKADGTAADNNPFADQQDAQPEIWSYGHRNMQSAALDGQGRLWTVEHGPKGGDELNLPEGGKNYGWPVITYGLDYSGQPIGEGITAKDGMEQPVYYWDPVIGPSGMVFYEGDQFADWDNTVLIGGLVSTGIVVLHLDNDRVASEERIPLDARVRDVKVGEDGAIYAVTENPNAGTSTILKVTPEA